MAGSAGLQAPRWHCVHASALAAPEPADGSRNSGLSGRSTVPGGSQHLRASAASAPAYSNVVAEAAAGAPLPAPAAGGRASEVRTPSPRLHVLPQRAVRPRRRVGLSNAFESKGSGLQTVESFRASKPKALDQKPESRRLLRSRVRASHQPPPQARRGTRPIGYRLWLYRKVLSGDDPSCLTAGRQAGRQERQAPRRHRVEQGAHDVGGDAAQDEPRPEAAAPGPERGAGQLFRPAGASGGR